MGVYAMHLPSKSFGHEFLLTALHRLLEEGVLHAEDRICYLGSQRKEQRTSYMEMNIVKNLLSIDGKELLNN